MSEITNDHLLIHVESGLYPVSLTEFKRLVPGYLFGATVPEEIINESGYRVVDRVDAPIGDVVVEQPPQPNGARYVQIYSFRAFNEQEKAEQLALAKEAALNEAKIAAAWTREQGAPYQFASGEQHVQLRDVDISNLTGLGLKADRDPSRTYYFRSQENVTNALTGAEVRALTDYAFERFERFLEAYWGVQNVIEGCTSIADIPSKEVIRQTINSSVLA